MSAQHVFAVYLTDLFGGELNYSWVTRMRVRATTERGAVHKVARATGLHFRADMPGEVYHSVSGATALVIEGVVGEDDSSFTYDYTGAEEF